jgi:leucyl aminopeptidase
MKLAYQRGSLKQFKCDVAVVFADDSTAGLRDAIASARKYLGKRIDAIVKLEEFKGKEGETLSIYTEGKLAAPRLFLIGLGDAQKNPAERLRRAAASAAKKARSVKAKHVAFELPSSTLGAPAAATAIAEGSLLALYSYDKYLTQKKESSAKVVQISIVEASGNQEKEIKKALNEAKIVCEGVCFARDLENAPGNEVYPETLAACASTSAEKYGYSADVWERKKLEEEGFGGVLAVNAGSEKPPRFIIMEYNGVAGDAAESAVPVVLVGKGVTFDSGGISIKPAASMAEMKMDMSGAAAVIGALETVARLKLPVRVIGLVPSVENMPSGSSMRPGDIITHYGGQTSEVDNTDAEGRLILADALGYALTFKPSVVIDLATLTGACVVALGSHAAGMMGTDEATMAALKTAGETVFERVWPLPLFEEYEKQIRSDVADVKNVGGRWGGAITAGLFLKKFVKDYPWVHLDIAGTAILEEDFPYAPRGGSGYGVRLLVEFLRRRS